MNEAQQDWIYELRSGIRTKCTGYMRKTENNQDSYCVLGVANLVLGGCWEVFRDRNNATLWRAVISEEVDGFLPREFLDTLGLSTEDELRLYKINDGCTPGKTRTFAEIADLLEAYFVDGTPLPEPY